MNIQPIFNIAEILARLGVREAVLSPGSRNAPLIMAFARHPDITCYSISDERSAAFVALGMARVRRLPVVLACTSGSAALNYSPAVAEAYFQQIPLIVLTADRPPEWVAQLDGQTIWQNGIYGPHVKKSIQLQADLEHKDAQWHVHRAASEAWLAATAFPAGPVHINTPFREPFYPEQDDEMYFNSDLPVHAEVTGQAALSGDTIDSIAAELDTYPRKLIIGGQHPQSKPLSSALADFTDAGSIPVIGDILSNLHSIPHVFKLADLYAVDEKPDVYNHLKPDLLITFGQSIISKNVKLFLRKNRPAAHWHIQEAGPVADTYQSVSRVIRCSPEEFFRSFTGSVTSSGFEAQKQENYLQLFHIEERKIQRFTDDFFQDQPLGEFEMVRTLLNQLPESCHLHLANSMAVRYANWCGIPDNLPETEVMANRGTSGIDGCTSTAVGSALASGKLTILITGDVGFFYDRNAFWHNYPLGNLRILLLNNHGGGIFRMISGPGQLPELEEFFETRQALTARSLAEEFGFEYLLCDKKSKTTHFINDFLKEDKRPKILEVETEGPVNQEILRYFKQGVNRL